ncbi:MAG TPA: MetQ/NlpA family ABC transporter substrate-binding protein [Fastidiosipila sp.]|nr:MetQ/NlpA family ABC transporter substrate-binding protein [Fastidiosipila sp.]
MKTKKVLALLLLALTILVSACAGPTAQTTAPADTTKASATEPPAASDTDPVATDTDAPAENEKIVIGVTPNPHETLVKLVVDDLKEKGVDVEIKVFNDYFTPNQLVHDGELDANYFQHIPFFDNEVEEKNLKLEILGGIHIEPMGIYSTKIKSLDELKEGDEVLIPNDTVNGGRALLLLQAEGVIELKDGGTVTSTERDIEKNEKNLKFVPLEAAAIPRSYQDAAIGIINGNYALDNDLNPVEDSIVLEGASSPYVNIIAVREGEAKLPKFQALLEALQSDEVKTFIEKEYGGSVVTAFSKP